MPILSRPIHEVLPIELIVQVLDAVYARKGGGSNDIVRLSRVDQAMRVIIMSCPRYWASITIDTHPSSAAFAKLCVERSKDTAIILDIIIFAGPFPSHFKEIAQVLFASAPRVKLLNIVMNSYDLLRAFRPPLKFLQMPRLETLILDYDTMFHGGPDRDVVLPDAPKLHSLTVQGVVPNPLLAQSFVKLTCLRIGAGTCFGWPTDSLALILHHASSLEELYLEGEEATLTADEFEWEYALHCRRLRSLSIFGADTPFVVQVLINLQAPLLETVRLNEPSRSSNHEEEIEWDDVEIPSHRSVRNLMVYTADDEHDQDDFLVFVTRCFPGIVTLEVERPMTKILNFWADDNSEDDCWIGLENLKVVGKEGDAGEAIGDVANFVEIRSQWQSCRKIKILQLDTEGLGDNDEEELELLEMLKREVETVQYGKIERTPWERSPYA